MDEKKKWNFPYPENLKKYNNLSTMSGLLTDDIVDKVLPFIDTLALYLNMEILADSILDELAIMWSVQFYSTKFPRETKISLIKNSYYFNSQKGTTGILGEALKTIYTNLYLIEWFNYGGNPYYFKIKSDKAFTNEELNKILTLTSLYKNVRSILESIGFKTDHQTNIDVGGVNSTYTMLQSVNDISEVKIQTGSLMYYKLESAITI